jgi:CubicO group peptidase (beta-lactamase class C family)
MRRLNLRGALVALLMAMGVAGAGARELPTASPESVGMTSEGLARINDVMRRHIEAGTIVNAVTLVVRRGKIVHYEAHGLLDPAARTPMRKDAIFRMASSSKPITAVGILALADDGRLSLSDPVSRYIPEFAEMKVAMPKPGAAPLAPLPPGSGAPTGPRPEADLVPAARPVTLQDLLTHTSGLMSGGLGNRLAAVERGPSDTLAAVIPRFGAVALDFQPGTRWSYSAGAGFDTLGRIIEIVSGKTLDVYLQERIFGPLQMTDVAFVVPQERKARMNSLYRKNPQGTWEATPPPPAFASDVYFSGAGGLVGTARDYARFEQMLLNGGTLDGRRILSKRSVELMRTDQIPGLFHGMAGGEEGMGFGHGVAVTLDSGKARWRRSNGSAGWYGAFGTMSWNDPREQIVGVIMLQQSASQVQVDFGAAILEAILPAK